MCYCMKGQKLDNVQNLRQLGHFQHESSTIHIILEQNLIDLMRMSNGLVILFSHFPPMK